MWLVAAVLNSVILEHVCVSKASLPYCTLQIPVQLGFSSPWMIQTLRQPPVGSLTSEQASTQLIALQF